MDLYISPAGNDGNPCTQALPGRTIGHAVSLSGYRDKLYLEPGTYDDPDPVHIVRSIELIGPKTAIIESEIFVDNGADFRTLGTTFRQVSKTSSQPSSQIFAVNSSVRLIDTDAVWQSGTKGFIQTSKSEVNLIASGDDSTIDYSGNTSKPALSIFGDSLLWASEAGGKNLTVRSGAFAAVYLATSRLTWLSGDIEGGGHTPTPHVVLGIRVSDILISAGQISNGNRGVQITLGTKAYVAPAVTYSGITQSTLAQTGAWFL